MERFHELEDKVEDKEQAVLEELQELARPHADASNGLFRLLDINPDQYPAQSLTTYKVTSEEPQSPGVVELIATGIEGRFPEIPRKLEELEEKAGAISLAGEALDAGKNIILVTNHGDIKDIAYTLAGYYIKLKERGFDGFHSSLVMSKIISFLGVNVGEEVDPDPAVNILKTVCDTQFFSFPRTKSIAKSRIAGPIVDAYNTRARLSMKWQLRKGSNLFAMAASGTTDKPVPDLADTLQLGTIGHGTAKLMMHKNSLVLPVAVWVDENGIIFEPCTEPRPVSSEEEAHDVMQSIAHTLNTLDVGKKFIYQKPAGHDSY